MRVVVELQAFPPPAAAPPIIDGYCASLACAIVRHAGNYDVHVVVTHCSDELLEKLRDSFADLFCDNAFSVAQLPFLDGGATERHWHRAAAELVREHAILQLKPDVVLCAPLTSASILVSQLHARIPTAVALSGLHFATRREMSPEHDDCNSAERHKQGCRAELVLTGSEYYRQVLRDTLQMPAECVVVVPPGVNERFRPSRVSEGQARVVTGRFGVTRDFILSNANGTVEGVERALEAYAQLPGKLRSANRLMVVGVIDNDQIRQAVQSARSKGLVDGELVVAADASEDELAVLYNQCKLMVLPSAETSAQPALDAMSCGAAVLGPDQAGIPEIIGLHEALFDPASARDLSEKICLVLESTEFHQKLKVHALEQALRFSWRESARRGLDALAALPASRLPPSKSLATGQGRPRMAYLSPLPPERSGVADYSAELLPELAHHYKVELITDSTQIADPFLQRELRRVSLKEFEQCARGYERILYHIGNSPFHLRIPHLLEQYPGPVVLHDFFLSHLFKDLETSDGVSLWRNLYGSHGYPGLLVRVRRGADAAVWEYPCNLAVLSHAGGIIVHSEHAKHLAREWFGISTENWRVIPQLRRLSRKVDREQARRTLGVPLDAFLVCSFGFLAPTKLNDLLFQGWLGSGLARLPNCSLVFAGGDGAGRPYQANGMSSANVRSTGYLSKDDYELYLAAADVGVQLRGELSRGETPRSVLDCMAHGVATIVSSHPALSDLPGDSVLMLPDNCSKAELIGALERLYREPRYRAALGQNAQEYIVAKRTPAVIARQYAEAVEEFASSHPAALTSRASVSFATAASNSMIPDGDFATLASCLAENTGGSASVRQLLVDVTVLVSLGDSKTGIHRTTRGVLAQLLENPPSGWRVEPVFRGHCETYRYARKLVCNYLNLKGLILEDAPVVVNPGDVFLGLDWDPGIAVDDNAAQWLLHHRLRGMRTVFTIYDLLPLQHSEWFKPEMQPVFRGWLSRICRVADGFACISRAVADDLMSWLDRHPGVAGRALDIGYFHLGSDLEKSWASEGISPDDQKLLDALRGRELLVMIGTVEPRKGHSQVLSAMERLWAGGENLSLVVCGVQGWLVDPIAQRLRSHPEIGRRLFWLEQATDQALLRLYSIASAALMASEGEGFGLPLVEAAKHDVPIIARDLPVFREVAADHAFYFSGPHPTDLANAVENWLRLYRCGEHPRSKLMPWLTWEQSTQQLLQLALQGNVYRRWLLKRTLDPGQSMDIIANGGGTGTRAVEDSVVQRDPHMAQPRFRDSQLAPDYAVTAETSRAFTNRAD